MILLNFLDGVTCLVLFGCPSHRSLNFDDIWSNISGNLPIILSKLTTPFRDSTHTICAYLLIFGLPLYFSISGPLLSPLLSSSASLFPIVAIVNEIYLCGSAWFCWPSCVCFPTNHCGGRGGRWRDESVNLFILSLIFVWFEYETLEYIYWSATSANAPWRTLEQKKIAKTKRWTIRCIEVEWL